MKTLLATTMIAAAALCGTVQAAPVKELGQFGSWNAIAYTDGNGQRCFIVATPAAEEPSPLRHGDVHFFVQTQGSNPGRTESSFQTGYPFADDSTVTLTIGAQTFRMITSGQSAWLARLEQTIADRQNADPAASYTARLLAEGPTRIAQKVGEEGVETALAGAAGSDDQLRGEAADLLFHLLVLLRARGTGLEAVLDVLRDRGR